MGKGVGLEVGKRGKGEVWGKTQRVNGGEKWESFKIGNKAVRLEVRKRERVGKVEGLRWGKG